MEKDVSHLLPNDWDSLNLQIRNCFRSVSFFCTIISDPLGTKLEDITDRGVLRIRLPKSCNGPQSRLSSEGSLRFPFAIV